MVKKTYLNYLSFITYTATALCLWAYDLLYYEFFINVKCKLKKNVHSVDFGNEIPHMFLSLIF